MTFKEGDKVILNLHTIFGNLCIKDDEHGKEFTIMEYTNNNSIAIGRPTSLFRWYVRSEMITLVDPQMIFDFMKE